MTPPLTVEQLTPAAECRELAGGGKAIAKARDEWFASLSGATLEGAPSGKYLSNRLELAFIAGWDAALEAIAPHLALTKREG